MNGLIQFKIKKLKILLFFLFYIFSFRLQMSKQFLFSCFSIIFIIKFPVILIMEFKISKSKYTVYTCSLCITYVNSSQHSSFHFHVTTLHHNPKYYKNFLYQNHGDLKCIFFHFHLWRTCFLN